MEFFSVRSAYRPEMENLANKCSGCSSIKDSNDVWKVCWKMHVHNTVKMFMWRALNNLLPRKVNLAKKGVCQSRACPICEREDETIVHIIWSYSSWSYVWGCGLAKIQKCGNTGIDFPNIVRKGLVQCEREEFELFAITARRLWLRRNSVVHGESFTHPTQLMREAKMSLAEFQRVQQGERLKVSPALERNTTKWTPPPGDTIKMNWDAAMNVKDKRIGLGFIARNLNGGGYGCTKLN
jgi:hypothetical protein